MKLKIYYFAVLMISIYLFFTYISIAFEGLKVDEKLNHFLVIEAMNKNGFIDTVLGENYEAANTPLPYLFAYIPMKVFNIEPSIKFLRIINAIVSLISITIFTLILIKFNARNIFAIIITSLFYPYFLKTSFTYYMAIYGILFFQLFLLSALSESKYRWLFAGLSLAGAILSQQFYFVVFPAAFYYLYSVEKKQNLGELIKKGLMLGIPTLILALPLFIAWGGLTHPDYSFHKVSFDMTKITAIAVITGGLCLPLIGSLYKKLISMKILYFVIISQFFVLFFLPGFAPIGAFGLITGYTWHALELLSRLHPLIKIIAATLLFTFALFSIGEFLRTIEDNLDKILFLSLLSFLIGFLINETLMERHLLPMAITIFAISLRKIQSKYFVYATTLFYVIFGSYYYYYYLYIHDTF